MVEVEVEVLEGTVLDAQRLEGAPVDLRRQVPQQEPPESSICHLLIATSILN